MIGMEQNNDSIGRDTEVCGDPLFWFPMRVTYSRVLKVKAELNRLARPRILNHEPKVALSPVIAQNMIFL